MSLLVLCVLAAFDAWSFAQWAFNIVYTILLGYVATKNRKIDTMEEKLEQQAQSLVANQITQQVQPLKSSIDALTRQMSEVVRRLDAGEGDFKALMQADHQVELRAQQIFRELETNILREFATKSDVKEVEEKVTRLQQFLASDLVARIERASQAMEQAASVQRAAAERMTGKSVKG